MKKIKLFLIISPLSFFIPHLASAEYTFKVYNRTKHPVVLVLYVDKPIISDEYRHQVKFSTEDHWRYSITFFKPNLGGTREKIWFLRAPLNGNKSLEFTFSSREVKVNNFSQPLLGFHVWSGKNMINEPDVSKNSMMSTIKPEVPILKNDQEWIDICSADRDDFNLMGQAQWPAQGGYVCINPNHYKPTLRDGKQVLYKKKDIVMRFECADQKPCHESDADISKIFIEKKNIKTTTETRGVITGAIIEGVKIELSDNVTQLFDGLGNRLNTNIINWTARDKNNPNWYRLYRKKEKSLNQTIKLKRITLSINSDLNLRDYDCHSFLFSWHDYSNPSLSDKQIFNQARREFSRKDKNKRNIKSLNHQVDWDDVNIHFGSNNHKAESLIYLHCERQNSNQQYFDSARIRYYDLSHFLDG